jgi:putative hemolysin
LELKQIIQEPIFIAEGSPAFKILNLFKTRKQYIAVVVDEYGSTKGILTLHDLTEAIVGDLPDEDESDELNIFKRSDISYLIDGKTLIYELNQYFQRELIEDNISEYATISGFILAQLRSIPTIGEKLSYNNFVLEIVDMDGIRIDKVLLTIEE